MEHYFDEDLEARRKELAAIKISLERASRSAQKRAAAKDEIIELQSKLLEHEPNVLGFFSDDAGMGAMYRSSTGPIRQPVGASSISGEGFNPAHDLFPVPGSPSGSPPRPSQTPSACAPRRWRWG